jgi:hypothetical protein
MAMRETAATIALRKYIVVCGLESVAMGRLFGMSGKRWVCTAFYTHPDPIGSLEENQLRAKRTNLIARPGRTMTRSREEGAPICCGAGVLSAVRCRKFTR